jgi:ubiquinone/menaquinone biosynthesis C-methylase UbiE
VPKGFEPKRVKSYDLVSIKPFITAADIANLPLKDESVSVCIFCLSLMGTNYLQFIREARRVLKNEGELIISEVESRSPNWSKFVDMISAVGFRLANDALKLPNIKKISNNNNARFFRTMLFKKDAAGKTYLGYQGKGYPLD